MREDHPCLPNTVSQALDAYDYIDVIMRPHRLHYVGWFENCLVPGHLSDLYYQEAGHLMVRRLACVCHTPNTTLPTPQSLFRPVNYVLKAAHAVIDRIGGRYCGLHVRRGDKLHEVPGLDTATRPDAIAASIRHLCKPGRRLYIGSNEGTPGFFDPLKDNYKIFTYRCGCLQFVLGVALPTMYVLTVACNRDFADVFEPAGIVRISGRGEVEIVDNFALYQAEVEIMLHGSPFMDTFCVLARDVGHLGCNVDHARGRNSGYYGVRDLGLIGG